MAARIDFRKDDLLNWPSCFLADVQKRFRQAFSSPLVMSSIGVRNLFPTGVESQSESLVA